MIVFWQSFSENLSEASKIAGYISALAAFLFGFYKFVLIPVFKHFKLFNQLFLKIETIYREITPNSGNSIKDVIKRLDNRTLNIEEKLNIMQGIQDAIREDGPIGLFECSVEGENYYVNRTYAKWLGCSKSDLMDFGWKNYLASFALKKEYDSEWKQAFKEHREVRFPIAFKDKYGKKFFCDVRAYPIKDPNGNLVNYLGILSREENEEELISKNTIEKYTGPISLSF